MVELRLQLELSDSKLKLAFFTHVVDDNLLGFHAGDWEGLLSFKKHYMKGARHPGTEPS
jgi:hypothetical protein